MVFSLAFLFSFRSRQFLSCMRLLSFVLMHLFLGIRMMNLCPFFLKKENMSGVGKAPSKDTKSNFKPLFLRSVINSWAISTFDLYRFYRLFFVVPKNQDIVEFLYFHLQLKRKQEPKHAPRVLCNHLYHSKDFRLILHIAL